MSINKQIEKCSVFYLSDEKVEEFEFDSDEYISDPNEVSIQWADTLTQNISLFPGILRGDVVSVFSDEERERNDGLFIYDGSKVLPLDTEHDEYGHLPSTFKVEEFYPQYWSEIITHNQIVWFNPRIHNYTNYIKADDNTIIVNDDQYKIVLVSNGAVDRFYEDIKNSQEDTMVSYHHEDAVIMIDLDYERYEDEFKSDKKTFIVVDLKCLEDM